MLHKIEFSARIVILEIYFATTGTNYFDMNPI